MTTVKSLLSRLLGLRTSPPVRISWCWARDWADRWWIVRMQNGEPDRAFHPVLGESVAYRDSFRYWAKATVPNFLSEACGAEVVS
jgi:hypothetical protein